MSTMPFEDLFSRASALLPGSPQASTGSSFKMTEPTAPAHYKVEMPQIPGVTGPSSRPPRRNPLLPLIIAFLVLGLVILVAVRWFAHNKPVEPVRVEQAPQIEVPPPPPDPTASQPRATEANPVIATVADLAKPWSSVDFFVRNRLTGENVPATIIRLPTALPRRLPAIGRSLARLLTVLVNWNTSPTLRNCAMNTAIAMPAIPWSAIPAAIRSMIH